MMNDRTMTVKGLGDVTVKPDLIVLSIALDTNDKDYKETLNKAACEVDAIRKALNNAGYEMDSLKTTNFSINTDYESYKDNDGNWKRRFNGYLCKHRLKLSFDFDMELLNKTIAAIASCSVNPVYDIVFSVKNNTDVSEQLLTSAVNNAKQKASVLAAAASVKLGNILHIDYNWGELHLFSDTHIEDPLLCADEAAPMLDIAPDDINVNDTVTITWAIS